MGYAFVRFAATLAFAVTATGCGHTSLTDKTSSGTAASATAGASTTDTWTPKVTINGQPVDLPGNHTVMTPKCKQSPGNAIVDYSWMGSDGQTESSVDVNLGPEYMNPPDSNFDIGEQINISPDVKRRSDTRTGAGVEAGDYYATNSPTNHVIDQGLRDVQLTKTSNGYTVSAEARWESGSALTADLSGWQPVVVEFACQS